MGVIQKMKEILLTEKEMVFRVLLYFHGFGKAFPLSLHLDKKFHTLFVLLFQIHFLYLYIYLYHVS